MGRGGGGAFIAHTAHESQLTFPITPYTRSQMTVQGIATIFGPTLGRRRTEDAETMGKGVLLVQDLLRVPTAEWDRLCVASES